MFLNKTNGKLYPDYRDQDNCFSSSNNERYYRVPEYFIKKGFPKYVCIKNTDEYYTKKQLEKKKLQPMEGYYGMKWWTNCQHLSKKYYYNIECTEPLKKDGDANPKQ